MKRLSALAILVGFLIGASSAAAQPTDDPLKMAAIFANDMVLQRGQPIRIWGDAAPSSDLVVTVGGESQSITASSDGRWSVVFPSRQSGADIAVSVRNDQGVSHVIQNVQFGDVFLCSGQSNMEVQLFRALNPHFGFYKKGDDKIRYAKIARSTSAVIQTDFSEPVDWKIPSEANNRNFSAVCMYFGREIAAEKGVPVGLIQSTWGGAQIESWISQSSLSAFPELAGQVEHLRIFAEDEAKGFAVYGAQWTQWWNRLSGGFEKPWRAPESKWKSYTEVPDTFGDWRFYGDESLSDYVGMVWYYNEISLSAMRAGLPNILDLGGVGEHAMVWINDTFVGSATHRVENQLTVPAGVLRPGQNTISVGIAQISIKRPGGLLGPASAIQLRDSGGETPIKLGTGWRYQKSTFRASNPPKAPWQNRNGYTVIYNGMIAPLRDLAMSGAIWYQGESNTHNAEEYEALLTAMLDSWRKQFGHDLPFIIVEVANYGPLKPIDSQSSWAQIRESQRRVAEADAKAAVVVTHDIGEKYDIHPQVKWPVAKRAMQAARYLVYGEDVPPSGPRPKALRKTSRTIEITFKDYDGTLMAASANRPFPFMVCENSGTCDYVDARLDGARVVLDLPAKIDPDRVRYCWADSPICNLFDTAGTPAGPFELEIK